MKAITVFVGGSLGSDPYSPRTWSGSSRFFLAALNRASLLDRAVGVRLPKHLFYTYLLRNVSFRRSAWRKQFYLDPRYRDAMTRQAARAVLSSAACMQLGAMFSLPEAFPRTPSFSYSDGNLVESLASGFGFEGVSRKRIDQALRFEEECAQGMASVFTFSEYLRESCIRNYRLSPEKVISVGGGVNLEEIPEAIERDYSAQKLLFVGVDFHRKGGPQLLEAFARLRESYPGATLHIVGPSSIGLVPDGVVFHGRLSKQDPVQRESLDSLFRESTLFVMPSLYEPFGIAPLEAMLYGLPCLVSDGWALREQVKTGVNGALCEPGSVDDLVEKLANLLRDPEQLAFMGLAGRQMVIANYTWDAVIKKMQPVFQKTGIVE